MSRTLESIAQSVAGRVVGEALAGSTRVDAVLDLDAFQVAADRDFISLVAADPEATRVALAAGRLRGAVATTVDDGADWEAIAAATASTILLGAAGGDAVASTEALRRRIEGLLAVDRAAEDRFVTLGTKVLTQVARRGGVEAVVAELAHRIDGWAVLLDAHGEPIATAGAGSLHVQDAAAFALQRMVRVRHPGLQLHPVGEGGDLSAFLVISSRDASASSSRDLAAQAAALLDLVLRTHDHTVTERLGRELMMSTLFSAPTPEARALLRRWGAREAEFTAFVLSSRTRIDDLDGLVTRWLDELAVPHLVSAERGRLVGLVTADRAEELMNRIAAVALETRAPLRCGVGGSAGVEALGRTAAEARQAHEVALSAGRAVVRYSSLPTVRYLLDRLGPEPTGHLAVLLDPLRAADGRHGVLVETLRVFLAEHGAWGVTAAHLGVHRQTLASRMRRIEQLCGLSMSDPDDRAAAWLAIRAVERELVAQRRR